MSYKGKSLLELKRQQWAKEREEIARMGEVFSHSSHKFERTSVRTYFSNLDLSQNNRKDQHLIDNNNQRGSYELVPGEEYSQRMSDRSSKQQRLRSPSLPAIQHKNYKARLPVTAGQQEEDTSGYTSDSANNPQSPDIWYSDDNPMRRGMSKDYKNFQNFDKSSKMYQHHQQHQENRRSEKINYNKVREQGLRMSSNAIDAIGNDMDNSYNSSFFGLPSSPSNVSRDVSTSSTFPVYPEANEFYPKSKEERAKWGDRSMNSWKAASENSSSYSSYKPGPGWLERGVHDLKDSEDDNQSVQSVSYIRGQNAPLDPLVLAERVNKRRRALEFQNAIKQQLEEREKLRQWEQERRLREERIEEERMRRQQEAEQNRLHYEHQLQLEKEEALRKKQEIMKQALAKAEEEARMERERRKLTKLKAITLEDRIRPPEIIHSNESGSYQQKFVSQATAENDAVSTPMAVVEPVMEKVSMKNVELSPIHMKRTKTPTIEVKRPDTPPVMEERSETPPIITADPPKSEIIKPELKKDEKVLIGTPINLRKSIVKAPDINDPKISVKQDSEMDGIALVIQPTTLLPLPVTTDIFTLQNTIGNLQMAAMLMQQTQLMNRLNADQKLAANNDTVEKLTAKPLSATRHVSVETNTADIDTLEIVERTNQINSLEQTASDQKKCRLCGKRHGASLNNNSKPASGSITVVRTTESDTQTPTLDVMEKYVHKTEHSFRPNSKLYVDKSTQNNQVALMDTEYPEKTQESTSSTQDAQTQTDSPSTCELCLLHNNFYKIFLKREVSTTTTTQTTKPNPEEDIIPDKASETTTTTTTTTTTEYRAKSKLKKAQEKLEERPKWGVNRPLIQYVKASERDPFYLRNKKKKLLKAARSLSVDSREMETNRSVTKARNVCTEILPIKTDENGRIFLNFREASTIMNEDEIKEKLRERYISFGKILAKRNWDSDGSAKEIMLRHSSNPDLDVEIY